MREHFDRIVSIETEDYDNQVLVAANGDLTGAGLRRCVAESPVLSASLPILSFRLR